MTYGGAFFRNCGTCGRKFYGSRIAPGFPVLLAEMQAHGPQGALRAVRRERFYTNFPQVDSRFCSIACQVAWQGRNKTNHVCETCGGEFRRSPFWSAHSAQRYCSIPCRNADPSFKAQLLAMNTLLQAGRVTRLRQPEYALLDLPGSIRGAECLRREVHARRHDRVGAAHRPVRRRLLARPQGISTEARIRRRVALDRSQDAYAEACGWRVLRLWETDLAGDARGCEAKVLSALRGAPVSPGA